ncbi:type III-A CRISPR-associated RAMP protein Csm3 [Veillonella caviae]|uniref:type III-A CRISPR-associated RAMP protein Csm3 n=1 Tax=Veillonella caviae TaxID=248316 RepID=UPI0023F7DB74|nr:type III-A CRISPR-associated RAMP protein Csm3 [Veillonella caviae]
MADTNQQKCLRGKLMFTGTLMLETGMHIGASSDFAPIGSVDTPFIRDVVSQEPIVPGSSLKGKLRTLLARHHSKSYILPDIKDDDIVIKRLFGSVSPVQQSRLQFYDLFVAQESRDLFKNLETDTYMGEVKFENTINRVSGTANPRQIERVPAKTKFDFKLVYNIEAEEELQEDLKTLKLALDLLAFDYLGGHGSRGYGRVKLAVEDVQIIGTGTLDKNAILDIVK